MQACPPVPGKAVKIPLVAERFGPLPHRPSTVGSWSSARTSPLATKTGAPASGRRHWCGRLSSRRPAVPRRSPGAAACRPDPDSLESAQRPCPPSGVSGGDCKFLKPEPHVRRPETSLRRGVASVAGGVSASDSLTPLTLARSRSPSFPVAPPIQRTVTSFWADRCRATVPAAGQRDARWVEGADQELNPIPLRDPPGSERGGIFHWSTRGLTSEADWPFDRRRRRCPRIRRRPRPPAILGPTGGTALHPTAPPPMRTDGQTSEVLGAARQRHPADTRPPRADHARRPVTPSDYRSPPTCRDRNVSTSSPFRPFAKQTIPRTRIGMATSRPI